MAWETRRGRQYYYSKERRGGKVVSVYYGCGPLAGVHGEWMEGKAEEKEMDSCFERLEREEFEGFEEDSVILFETSRLLLNRSLLSSGYHLHKGQWRRKRVDKV